MEYKLIDEYFNALNLRKPNLTLLRPDADYYTSLLLQPQGTLAFGNDFIRIADIPTAEAKFNSFFDLASEKNVDLAITPEYSCPWSVIANLVDSSILPEENKIWVVGCESIKAGQLNDFINQRNNITWIVENAVINGNLNNQRFFDPVCYIFKTRDNANTVRTVIIVQFKTHFLGGADLEWERDNFIPGSRIYILENSGNHSSRLLTLICSDALSPDLNNLDHPHFADSAYLIIHIQLNKAPNHGNYCQYRRNIYGMGRENKEFLCLNWARNVIVNNASWNAYGGSAFYIKPEKKGDINTNDERLNKNQLLGMYYTHWKDKYAHIFLLNYDEHVFFLRTTKPSQSFADPANRKRSGPEMEETLVWNAINNQWEHGANLDGGLQQTCVALNNGRNYNFILAHSRTSPIDTERLLYLSNGKATYENWFDPAKNTFFLIKDDEINKRMTFTQNPCPVTLTERRAILLKYGTLEYTIIIDPNLFPPSINDLANNCSINYRIPGYEDEFNLNLYPANNNGIPACGAFIGQATTDDAKAVLNKMISLFTKDQYGKRTVVWYVDDNLQTQKEFVSEKPKFTENTNRSRISIKSGKRR
ncbi:MAG: hypothetical protein JST26_00185 [Bacteroidetes bacterium]|nr:hypothetical protein [Bacteroidota bacterium]